MDNKKRFAVFDIDGTLIRWQLYHAVVNTLAKEGALGEGAYEDIHNARMVWKRRAHPDAFKHYERQMVQLYDKAVTGITVVKFQQAAERVLAEYKDQTYVYTRDLISSLKKDGYVLLAISGSHNELVEKLAGHYGFDDFVGSRYGRADGRFTGEKHVAAENKGGLLQEMVSKHGLSYKGSIAVGDTASDIPLLEKVEQPIAFNPERNLYQTAIQRGWKIVVERKNVIYELISSNDQYILLI